MVEMKDRDYLEKVLLGKLMNNTKDYYDNHSLLSVDLFKSVEHKNLFIVLDKSLQETGKCDMTDFYNKSKDKYNAIQLAHDCNQRAYDPYMVQKLILLLLEKNKMEQLEILVAKMNRSITNNE